MMPWWQRANRSPRGCLRWRWQAWDEDRPVRTAPLEKDTCTFKPGYLPRVRRFRIRATSTADPTLWGEATALVMPEHILQVNRNRRPGQDPKDLGPGQLIMELLGEDWRAPAGTRPFLDIRAKTTAGGERGLLASDLLLPLRRLLNGYEA